MHVLVHVIVGVRALMFARVFKYAMLFILFWRQGLRIPLPATVLLARGQRPRPLFLSSCTASCELSHQKCL